MTEGRERQLKGGREVAEGSVCVWSSHVGHVLLTHTSISALGGQAAHVTYHVHNLGVYAFWAYMPPHTAVIKHRHIMNFDHYF